MSAIRAALLHADMSVQLVHFSPFRNACNLCAAEPKLSCCSKRPPCAMWMRHYAPCTPHPRYPAVLHRMRSYNDRPHFATWAFYARRVFGVIAENTRTTMEQVIGLASLEEADWPMWVYGAEGDMKRDVHLVAIGAGSSYTALTGAHKATLNVTTAWNVPGAFVVS